ncbi:hypothetical protein HDU89_008972 [Geranomyces variabilis]|nr:hypothetical protein HDU89_008972 [Geranomyces variabilis]
MGVCLGADLVMEGNGTSAQTISFNSSDFSTTDASHVQDKLGLGDSPLTANRRTTSHQLASRDNGCIAAGTCFWLKSTYTNQCIQVPGSSNAAGLVLTEAPCTTANNLLWSGFKPNTTHIIFTSIASGQCVDNSNSNNPGNVIQYPCTSGNANQEWGFTDQGNNVYQFISRMSGLCLNFDSESSAYGTPLDQYYCHNAAAGEQLLAQTWTLTLPVRGSRLDMPVLTAH